MGRQHLRWFVRLITVKVLCASVLYAAATPTGFSVLGVLAAACGVVVGWRSDHARVGLCLTFLALLNVAVGMWPSTLNHSFLELMIVATLVGFWPQRQGDDTVDGLAVRVIWCVTLSVWLWGGVHKLAHGYYLNGEFFALAAAFDHSILAEHLRWLVNGSRWLQGVEPLAVSVATPVQIPMSMPLLAGDWLVLKTLARLLVLAEVLLPLCVLTNRFKRAGLIGLVGMQLLIAIGSGEYDFAITGTAVLLLALPKLARYGYPALMVAALAVATMGLTWAMGGAP